MASTPCNSNSIWKCPLIPVGLLLSGVRASPHGEAEAAAAQQTQQQPPRLHPQAQDGNGWGAAGRLSRPSAQGSDL